MTLFVVENPHIRQSLSDDEAFSKVKGSETVNELPLQTPELMARKPASLVK